MFTAFALLIGAVLGVVAGVVGNESNKQNVADTNAANIAQTNATNQANKEIAEKTNQTNIALAEKAQEFQKQESELAYQRSTQTNQIRELIAAGYSPQQAKEIVAGSGSAASYTPASAVTSTAVAPTMTAAQLQPFLSDVNGLMSSFSQLGQSLGSFADDIAKDDGGTVGYIEASKGISIVGEHLHQINRNNLTSLKSFQSFIMSHANDDSFPWIKDNIQVFKDIFNNPRASRALLHHISLMRDSFSNEDLYRKGSLEVKKAFLDNKHQELVNNLADMEIVKQGYINYMLSIDAKNYPTISRAKFEEAAANIARFTLDKEILDNDEYRYYHLMRCITDESTGLLTSTALGIRAKGDYLIGKERFDYLNNGENAAFMTILDMYKDAGFSGNGIGNIIAFMCAAGLDLPDYARNLIPELTDFTTNVNTISLVDYVIKHSDLSENDASDLVSSAAKYVRKLSMFAANPVVGTAEIIVGEKMGVLTKLFDILTGNSSLSLVKRYKE